MQNYNLTLSEMYFTENKIVLASLFFVQKSNQLVD